MNKIGFYSKYRRVREIKLKRHNVDIKENKKVLMKKLPKLFILICVVCLSCFALIKSYYYIYNSSQFELRKIKVTGNKYLSKNEILALAKIENNKNIFKINVREIKKRLKLNMQIKTAKVNRIFPDSIEIIIKEREPVAFLGEDKRYQIDDEIKIFPSIRNFNAKKKMFVLTGLNLSQPVKEDIFKIKQGLLMIDEIKKRDSFILSKITKIDIGDLKELTLFCEDTNQRFKIGIGNWDEKLDKLISTLRVLKEKEDNISYVDLRFRDEAVVMFK